jgi:FMN-dependent NADH-azoreductase
MKHILHLKSSLQGAASYSIKLGTAIVEKIHDKYPDNTIEEIDLVEMGIPHITPHTLRTLFTPLEQLSETDKKANHLSDELVKQLLAADIIVIGAPLINFTIPTPLKAWIDHITRPSITFGYGADGRPTGLVHNKKVYIAMSSGGVYSEGPGLANDFVAPYLTAFLGFLGMTNVTIFRAEGLKVAGLKENAMEIAVNSILID